MKTEDLLKVTRGAHCGRCLMCLNVQSSRIDVMDMVIEGVKENGLIIIGTREKDKLPLSYTVGMIHQGAPAELAIVGMPDDVAKRILSYTAELIIEGGEGADILEGREFHGVMRRSTTKLVEIPPDNNALHLATWFMNGQVAKGLQVVWSDIEGKFPGEGSTLNADELLMH